MVLSNVLVMVKSQISQQGVYFDLYRDKPVEEYLIHYVEVAIYRDGIITQASP